MRSKIFKSIISMLLIIIIACSLIYVKQKNQRKQDTYCTGCGFNYTYAVAKIMLEKYNKIFINAGQKDSEDLVYKIINEDDPWYQHLDPHTGEICTRNTNSCNWTKLAVTNYYDETELPIIVNIDQDGKIPSYKYTGNNIIPSFEVSYKGEIIDKSTYCAYIVKADSKGGNDIGNYHSYLYTNNDFAPVEPGLYYLNVLYDPDPTVSPFIGRTTAKFEIKEPKTLNPMVTLSETELLYDGNTKLPKIKSVNLPVTDEWGFTSYVPLSEDDYTVSYSNENSKEIGNYSVTVNVNDYKYHYVKYTKEGQNIYDDDWYSGSSTVNYSIVKEKSTPTPAPSPTQNPTPVPANPVKTVVTGDLNIALLKEAINNSDFNQTTKTLLIKNIGIIERKGTYSAGTISSTEVMTWITSSDPEFSILQKVVGAVKNGKTVTDTDETPSKNPTPSVSDDDTEVKTTAKEAKKLITAAKNQKVKGLKVSAKKKSVKLKWTKISGYKYQVQIASNKKFTKGKKNYTVKKATYTVKKLKSKKKYYIRVRTVRTINGQKVYGKWSTVMNKKTK